MTTLPWTPNAPTMRGWYWYASRTISGWAIDLVRVDTIHLASALYIIPGEWLVTEIKGLWSGPLVPPTLPQEP